jgi:hypothetical protein
MFSSRRQCLPMSSGSSPRSQGLTTVTICSAICAGPGPGVGQEGVALDALVGLDPQHPERDRPGGSEAGRGGVPALVQDDGDIGDSHVP